MGTGGLYAFETDSDSPANVALGFQSTGTDFTPGSITLWVTNLTGADLDFWSIGYEIYAFNDQDRSSSLNFSFATGDGTNFQTVDALDFTSPEARDASPQWIQSARGINLLTDVAEGERLWLRWSSDDVGGSGSRDEIALDTIRITGSASVPEPASTGALLVALTATACRLGLRRMGLRRMGLRRMGQRRMQTRKLDSTG